MTRFAIPLLVAAVLALASAPGAGAASIAYVSADGNVHLVSPDGARDKTLTTDASADSKYRSPSQIDDGRVVALRRVDGSTSAAFFLRREDGQALDTWLLPKSGVAGFSPFTGAQASPQGGTVVYDYRHFDCATNPCQGYQRVGFVAGPGQTNPCLINCHSGYLAPRWLPNSPYAVMLDDRFESVWVQKQGSATPVGWFQYGNGITIHSVDVRGGYALVAVHAGETEYFVLERLLGAAPQVPETRCSVNVPTNSRPRLSPDGAAIAWQAPQGVMVSPTPGQSGGAETLCLLAPRLVAAGGTEPDWGVADVPLAPAAPPAPPAGGGATAGAAGGGGGGGTAPALLTAVVAPKLAKALAQGFAVGFRCAGPCRVKATATVAKGTARRYGLGRGVTQVGAGAATLKRAGNGRVKIVFGAKARRKLAIAKRVAVRVTLSFSGAAGKRKLRREVTLKR